MSRNISIVLGFFISPLALLLVPVIFGIQATDSDWHKAITDYSKSIYPVALGGVLLVGLPVYFLFRCFGYANYITLVSAGAIGGAAFGALARPLSYSILFYARSLRFSSS